MVCERAYLGERNVDVKWVGGYVSTGCFRSEADVGQVSLPFTTLGGLAKEKDWRRT